MFPIERDLDNNNRLTFPMRITKRWGGRAIIHPATCAIIVRPKNIPLKDAIRSVEILLEEMRHELELQRKSKDKK